MKKFISLAIAASLISLCALQPLMAMVPHSINEINDNFKTRQVALQSYANQINNINVLIPLLEDQSKNETDLLKKREIDKEILELHARQKTLQEEYQNLRSQL